jgi:gluconolactonase
MPERFEIFDERFKTLLLPDSRLEKLASDCVWSEGPAYLPDDSLIWSDIPGNRLMRWSANNGVREFLKPAHFQNGHTLDLTGRLLACSHGERAVVRLEPDGTWRVLVDSYQGKRLNSPNDIVVKSDGTIWFTDPDYGLIQPHEGYGGTREQAGCFVYRFDPSTLEISAVITDMEKPNGLAGRAHALRFGHFKIARPERQASHSRLRSARGETLRQRSRLHRDRTGISRWVSHRPSRLAVHEFRRQRASLQPNR